MRSRIGQYTAFGPWLLFQPKPAVWAARALPQLKLRRIAQYLGNFWRYAVPYLLMYSLRLFLLRKG